MMKTIKTLLLSFAVGAVVTPAFAQKVNMNQDNVANNGYDVVNYFTTHTAKRGSKEFSTAHHGAIYYFVSVENQNAFRNDPQKFLPQYDGYCAFAMAKMNKKVPVDPETFRVDDGKLYLFFNDFYEGKPFNTLIPWVNNEAEMEKMANANWKNIKSQ